LSPHETDDIAISAHHADLLSKSAYYDYNVKNVILFFGTES